eukprot:3787702-Prymnesium_polylepis.2
MRAHLHDRLVVAEAEQAGERGGGRVDVVHVVGVRRAAAEQRQLALDAQQPAELTACRAVEPRHVTQRVAEPRAERHVASGAVARRLAVDARAPLVVGLIRAAPRHRRPRARQAATPHARRVERRAH